MPEITPFRALRFDADRVGRDLSRLVAPPYDVLDADDKAALLRRDARNIVAIDLPHVPPKQAGPPEAYAKAAELLQQRRGEGTLILDGEPALYVCDQTFARAGKACTQEPPAPAAVSRTPHGSGGPDAGLPPAPAGGSEARTLNPPLPDSAPPPLKRWGNQQEPPALAGGSEAFIRAGETCTRRTIFAAMRIEPFGTGAVFPHEHTFGGPKQDRLELMKTTLCQLSPIFGLYSDPAATANAALDVTGREPDFYADLDGVTSQVWIVRDAEAISRITAALADRPVYIADGHHRYGTALNYRDGLGEALPADHPARFVLIGLCAMEDPGCVILPTHRVLSGFGDVRPGEVFKALQTGLRTTTADPNLTDPERLLPADAPDDLGVYVAAGDRMYTGRFTDRAVLGSLAPDQSPAWRELDLAYVHRYLIDELVTRLTLQGRPPTVDYLKTSGQAVERARATNGIALICKPCTMAQLRAVSEAGDLMPQKSTFFYPKMATGLVVYPLD